MSPNLPRNELEALGARLRQRGLNARGLQHVLGLRFPLASRLDRRDWLDDDGPIAAVPVLLFCGRRRLQRARVESCFGDDTALLAQLGLLELDGQTALAPVAILPVAESWAVARWDRLPDDSSMHLCGSLPSSADGWLDVGTGAAFAPLFRPRLADRIIATDIDGDALELAEIGLALSGIDHVELRPGDLFDTDPPPTRGGLVTFNAPIVADLGSLMARFWDQVTAVVAPGGEVLVHCRADAVAEELPGDLVVAQYTPEGAEAFAVVRWCPQRPKRRRHRSFQLDERCPHARRDWILSNDSG